MHSDGNKAPAPLVTSMLSSHLLGPLFLEYEASIRQMERELRLKNQEVARQSEQIRLVIKENDELATRLEI